MPRTAKVPGEPATEILQIRLTPTDLTYLDTARGVTPRSEWVRTLIRRETGKAAAMAEAGLIEPEYNPAPPHRHKRGKLLSEVTIKGNTVATYSCATKGCTTELTS